jgi:hypothetical protein
MRFQPIHPPAVREFVEEVLRTGAMLAELVEDLVDALPEDAFPGEPLGEVVLEMLCGTVTPALEAAGARELQSARALVGAMGDRTIADLKAAAERAARR